MPSSSARYDARRQRTKGFHPRSPDRSCMNCRCDSTPRRFYCSDECSRLSRAKVIAPLLKITEAEALELIRGNEKGQH